MWIKEVALAVIGLSSGAIVAGGLFSFIVSLGVVSDFADRTHTANRILWYENAVILGGIWGNLAYVYHWDIPGREIGMGVFGLLAGVFVGCWAMALAEILNVFPIFVRRTKIVKSIPYLILSIALGKGVGSVLYFFFGW